MRSVPETKIKSVATTIPKSLHLGTGLT